MSISKNTILFLVTPFPEVARLSWALRAHGVTVIEVSLSLLEDRLQTQHPTFVIVDMQNELTLKVISNIKPNESTKHCIWIGLTNTIDSSPNTIIQTQNSLRIHTLARPLELHQMLALIENTSSTSEHQAASIQPKVDAKSETNLSHANVISIASKTQKSILNEDQNHFITTYKTRIENADYFSILGVPASATEQQIEEAYTALYEEYYSYRLTQSPQEQEDLQRIGEAIREAYSILKNTRLRTRYREACTRCYDDESNAITST